MEGGEEVRERADGVSLGGMNPGRVGNEAHCLTHCAHCDSDL